MIISDTHRFIFVHIPKCAGTSVRRALMDFDDADGRFSERVEDVPDFGRVDLTHLPLARLRAAFPGVFARFETHASYALCRNPFDRFPSGVAQRLKMYRGVQINTLSDREVAAEIDAVIGRLETGAPPWEPDFIHCARQIDFVQLDGAPVVSKIYRIEDLGAFFADVSIQVGHTVDASEPSNQVMVFRNRRLGPLLTTGSAFAKKLLPVSFSDRLRGAARQRFLRPAAGRISSAFESRSVRDFVERYYKDDIALHEDAALRATAAM